MCAKLHKSLYGTRDAALNWAQAYSEVLEKMGFRKGQSSPCSFFHEEWQIRTVVHGDDFLSEGPDASLRQMDAEMKKTFSLKTEVLGGDPGDVQSVKVLNRQISWKDDGIHWEADPRHVEILARHLGLVGASTVKTPGDKNDIDKTFRYRDVDGESEGLDEETANYVDELLLKKKHGASQGRSPSSPLMRKVYPKLTRWADVDSEDDATEQHGFPASRESHRRAVLCAEGWLEGDDKLWRKSFTGAEWMPRCEVGFVTHSVVRDRTPGVVIHDSAGATQFDNGRLSRAFRVPRDVDMVVEVNMTEDPSDQPVSWEDMELGPRESSEYRTAAARLNYLALDRPDILFASKECSRRMSSPGTAIGPRSSGL